MIVFNLPQQSVTGPKSETIREVRWEGESCVVNNDKFGPIKDVTLKGTTADEVLSKTRELISDSKADLFAILKQSKPYKVRGAFQSKLVYAEVVL
jgi:hypothetical protein